MVTRFNRRMVLRGAAGFTLGIPFLHSLLSPKREAIAQTLSGPKYFVGMGTCDGGIWQEFMYPEEGSLTDALGISDSGAVLVRPDGFVAWRTVNADGSGGSILRVVLGRLLS